MMLQWKPRTAEEDVSCHTAERDRCNPTLLLLLQTVATGGAVVHD